MGKQVVQVKLLPTPEQAAALTLTLRAVNEAANWTAKTAFAHGVPREYALRRHTYTELRDRGLGSQIAQLVIKKTCHAYATIAALIKAGRLQGKRAAKATGKPVVFRADAAQAFDDRCLCRGIALEDLKGIRDRVRLTAAQRGELNSWSFDQLQAFIAYKAKRAGVPVVVIDPANTSRRYPRCGHIAKDNRPNQAIFACRRCGLAGPADTVAAVNIRDRARTTWAFVNTPMVADTPHPAADTSDKPRTSVPGN